MKASGKLVPVAGTEHKMVVKYPAPPSTDVKASGKLVPAHKMVVKYPAPQSTDAIPEAIRSKYPERNLPMPSKNGGITYVARCPDASVMSDMRRIAAEAGDDEDSVDE